MAKNWTTIEEEYGVPLGGDWLAAMWEQRRLEKLARLERLERDLAQLQTRVNDLVETIIDLSTQNAKLRQIEARALLPRKARVLSSAHVPRFEDPATGDLVPGSVVTVFIPDDPKEKIVRLWDGARMTHKLAEELDGVAV